MLTNEFINKVVSEYTLVVSTEELDELEIDTVLNPEFVDGVAEASECADTLIEDLEYNGFNEDEIIKLFDGRYLHDGGPWGMIPHEARLYTDDRHTYYILIVEVTG